MLGIICVEITPETRSAASLAASTAAVTLSTVPLNFNVTISGTGKASAFAGLFLSIALIVGILLENI